MPVSLTKEEARELLDSRPGWLTFTSIGKDGYPHTIPIGFFRIDDDVYVGGRTGTQRLKNIERNPKVSVLVESGTSMQDIKGVLIQGDATAITEPAATLELMRQSMRARGASEEQLPKEPRPHIAYIKITPRRYISWDYSRQR
jgi:nitroimidazol reductase NimA-like FMN-containing flavoprotein (pyridoxamine 5'-phosphate oxidase superfamily)